MFHCTQVNEGQPAPPAVMSCPGCGNRSKRVDTLTVKRLVRRLPSGMVPAQYYFCSAKNCEVVYFPSNHDAPVYCHADLLVSVGVKQEDDAALVCYCFGVTSRQIREEIRRSVVSSSAARIKAEVKEGRCACELKNPSGKCCLEEVVRAMQEALHRGGALQGGTRICRARAAWATEPAATSPATSSGRSAPRGSGPRRRSPAKIAVPPEARSPQLSGAVESAQRTHTEESCEVSPCSFQIPTLKQELRASERVYNTLRRHQSRPAGYLTPQQFLTELQSQPKQIQSH